MKYQLIAVGPLRHEYADGLKNELLSDFRELGLDEKKYFEILDANQTEQINWDGTPVMVWFGGSGQEDDKDIELLNSFLESSFPVFPVVENLNHYADDVPSSLHRINGIEWDEARLAADILRAFRLSRKQRQAFISYRRAETRAVAVQLFAELSLHGYRAFLDTASVESGVDFQEALWGRMADVDLLIFLDSPNAVTSRWVYEELARAHDLGLGVLQLVWPNHSRTVGTEFCDFIQLSKSHFVNNLGNSQDYLADEFLAEVLIAAERTRIRSLNSRRVRVVSGFIDQARELDLDVALSPAGSIELYRNNQQIGIVFPVIGLPDASIVQQYEVNIANNPHAEKRIIYDGYGMEPEYSEHLEWLNNFLDLPTCQLDFVDDWVEKL